VPDGHSGLHSFLYSGGDEEHAPVSGATSTSDADAIRFTSDGTRRLPVPVFLAGLSPADRVAGVYSIYAADSTLMFVGISRNVQAAVRAHLATRGRSEAASLVVKTWDYPSRAEMDACREEWLADAAPDVPPGNGAAAREWAASARDVSAVLGRDAGEAEKKLKLRKAMADMTLVDEAEAADRAAAAAAAGGAGGDADARRSNLVSAVTEDDWSGEIDAQTAATLSPPRAAAPVSAAPPPVAAPTVVSPFAAAPSAAAPATAAAAAAAPGAPLELTPDNVDRVLDDVRPYLLSDGGNISVVSVDARSAAVVLRLEGACGSCASSTTTMKMGVERVLREAFPGLGDVSAVSEEAATPFGVAAVEAALDNVRGALNGLGGSVSCLSATNGEVMLLYSGPPKLAYGIELMLRDSVPGTMGVTFTDDDGDE